MDPGATHSFVSYVFASKLGWQTRRMAIPLSIATPLSDSLDTDVILLGCPVLVEGRELLVDLVLLDVMEFDVILEEKPKEEETKWHNTSFGSIEM